MPKTGSAAECQNVPMRSDLDNQAASSSRKISFQLLKVKLHEAIGAAAPCLLGHEARRSSPSEFCDCEIPAGSEHWFEGDATSQGSLVPLAEPSHVTGVSLQVFHGKVGGQLTDSS